jgi:glyoxylase-like metal-dependent hydrolase (beta-lactamase superfamily II)
MSIVHRMAVLLVGYEFIPLEVSYYGAGDQHWHAVPVCTYLLDTEAGYILVDAGVDEAKVRDPRLRARYFPQPAGYPTPLVTEAHELERQLLAMDVEPTDVDHLILTHLHYDHTGHVGRFRNARVHLQRKEYAGSMHKTYAEAYHPEDYREIPPERLFLYDGDTELFPGVTLLSTPGHTVGHQSVRVTLRDGRRYVLVGDVVDDRRNLRENLLPGGMSDKVQAAASIARIRRLMAEGVEAIFLHDAEQVREIPLAPEWL